MHDFASDARNRLTGCYQRLGTAVLLGWASAGWCGEVIYQNDLQQADAGALPSEFMVLNGEFTVKAENGQQFIELPGAPLDTFQLLFGPNEKAGVTASARLFGSRKGRLFPTFAVGLNGAGGFRLQVSPAKAAVEIFKGDKSIATQPFNWSGDQWMWLKLEVAKTGDAGWTVRGKVWAEGTGEPAAWLVSVVEKEEPPPGRASIWGSPFSGKPIRFDDLKVERVATK